MDNTGQRVTPDVVEVTHSASVDLQICSLRRSSTFMYIVGFTKNLDWFDLVQFDLI